MLLPWASVVWGLPTVSPLGRSQSLHMFSHSLRSAKPPNVSQVALPGTRPSGKPLTLSLLHSSCVLRFLSDLFQGVEKICLSLSGMGMFLEAQGQQTMLTLLFRFILGSSSPWQSSLHPTSPGTWLTVTTRRPPDSKKHHTALLLCPRFP